MIWVMREIVVEKKVGVIDRFGVSGGLEEDQRKLV